jgi:hypothetical protein
LNNQPYISFIIPTRDDDYRPNSLFILQTSLNVLIEQLQRHRIESEIIVVEWNPPPEGSPLAQSLAFSNSTSMVTLRIITVDSHFHYRYKHAKKCSMNGAVAPNVGIRRARGSFVLNRVQDCFYSEAILKLLASRSLSPQSVYRCDRYDVDPAVADYAIYGTSGLLDACSKMTIRRYSYDAVSPSWLQAPNLHTNACGDFLLASKESWDKIHGYWETPSVQSLECDGLALHALHASGVRQIILPDECRVYKLSHGLTSLLRMEQSPQTIPRVIIGGMTRLGFSQRTLFQLRCLLNYPKRRLANINGVLFDSYARHYLYRIEQWAKGIGPYCLNDQGWGLANEDLPDEVICKAEWDA